MAQTLKTKKMSQFDIIRATPTDTALSQMQTQMATARNAGIIVPHLTAPINTPEALRDANMYSVPDSITIQVASAAGGGAGNTLVGVLNQDLLLNEDDNGSGAGSITYLYQDGTPLGAIVSRILAGARLGVGAVTFGVALRANDTATGAGSPSSLAVANAFFATSDSQGRTQSLSLNMSADQTRKDFDDSISLFRIIQNQSRFTQFCFTAVPGITYTITLYYNPNFNS